MLTKFILRAAVAAAALTFSASTASAEQYRVLALEGAFFPEISYVQPGDQVTFVNMSGVSLEVAGANDSWSLPSISDGGETTLLITADMPNKYFALGTAVEGGNNTAGTLNFSGAPDPVEEN